MTQPSCVCVYVCVTLSVSIKTYLQVHEERWIGTQGIPQPFCHNFNGKTRQTLPQIVLTPGDSLVGFADWFNSSQFEP